MRVDPKGARAGELTQPHSTLSTNALAPFTQTVGRSISEMDTAINPDYPVQMTLRPENDLVRDITSFGSEHFDLIGGRVRREF